MDEPLITKYRPRDFGEVLGHDETMASIVRRLDSGGPPHAFLLTGPSGIGKTTVARIIASHIGAEVIEIDAGSSGSIETVRALIEQGDNLPLSGAPFKMYIIDECHGLSAPAKQAILKALEEPPPHLFFALCTTEAHRIPDTWKTRCFPIALKPVAREHIDELVRIICDAEGWQASEDILALVVEEATGQPRKAITLLERVYDAKDRTEAKRIIAILDNDNDIVAELASLLIQGKTWEVIRPVLNRLDQSLDTYEGIMIPLTRRFIGALLREQSGNKAQRLAEMVDAMTFPVQTHDPKAQFYAAMSKIMRWGTS